MTIFRRFLRGFRLAFGVEVPEVSQAHLARINSRRLTQLQVAVMASWLVRAVGGPNHAASLWAADVGLFAMIVVGLLLGLIEAGRLPRGRRDGDADGREG